MGRRVENYFTSKTPAGVTTLWNIDRANEIARGRTVLFESVVDMGMSTEMILQIYKDLNVPYAMQTQPGPKNPGVAVQDEGGLRLIDGWHRLYKVVATGQKSYPVVILTPEDAEQCIVGRFGPHEELKLIAAIAGMYRGEGVAS